MNSPLRNNQPGWSSENQLSSCTDASERLVDVFLVGTQKAGTTALDRFLRTHESFSHSEKKAPHFFDKENNFIGAPDYEKYHTNFSSSLTPSQLRCEFTPSYLFWPGAIERIHRYNPNAKLIAVLRNPKERAFSHWNMQRHRNYDSLDFLAALEAENERCDFDNPRSYQMFSYVRRGLYAQQIKQAWKFFNPEQTLFLRYEQLVDDALGLVNEIARFTGVEPLAELDVMKIHARPYKRAISAEEDSKMSEIFQSDITELESLLNWDCSEWYAPA